MKLLFCDNTIWGLVNFRAYVFRHFHECGHEIVLVAPPAVGTEMTTDIPGYARFIPVGLERAGRNPFSDLAYLWRLFRIYRRERPDWVFHYTIKPNIYGTLAARMLGIGSTAMVAGLGYAFSRKGPTGLAARLLYRGALHLARNVFVLNAANRDLLVRQRIVPAGKLVLLGGGEGIDTQAVREHPQNGTERVTFLMVARVLYDKGYAEFVSAAARLKAEGGEADFCLLGPMDETSPNAVPREQVGADAGRGLFRYLGFSTRPLDIMGRPGTVIVLPSYYFEGMNRSLMEACALGRPVITTDIPGCREMVDEGRNGYLVPPRDGDALAEAMRRYLRLGAEERRRMGHESRLVAEKRLDVRLVIAEYEKILGMRV